MKTNSTGAERRCPPAGGPKGERSEANTTAAYYTGAMGCSWMNDSGFWVVSRLGGLTERETLRTWTAMLTFVSVVGFLATWLASKLIPLV